MTNKDYYKSQLDKLISSEDHDMNIIITDSEGNRTNSLTLNNDSINALQEFLTKQQSENNNPF